MKKLQFIDIGKPFRIIGKICKDIERAFRFKGINVNFIGMLIDYIGIAFIFKWNLHLANLVISSTFDSEANLYHADQSLSASSLEVDWNISGRSSLSSLALFKSV